MGCKKCLLFFFFEPTNNLFWCPLVPKWVNLWTIIPHSAPLCCQWFYMLFWCPPYSHLFWDEHSFFICKIFHTFTKARLLFLHLLHYGTFKTGKQKQDRNLKCLEIIKHWWTCCYFLLLKTEPSIIAHALAFLGWTYFSELLHLCLYHRSGLSKN